MPNQKGFAPIIIIMVIVIILALGIGAVVLGIVKIPSSLETSQAKPASLKIESPLKDQYKNPFRSDQESYTNPFTNLK